MNRAIASLLGGIAGVLLSAVAATAAMPNAFYAMDNATGDEARIPTLLDDAKDAR